MTLIHTWQPDDRLFWAREGGAVARRNLLISIPALVLAFAVWGLWSTVVVYLPQIGFRFTTNQLFWLVALPALCGAGLRAVYAFVVPLVGGRCWTVISTASLAVPVVGLGIAVQDPATSYSTFVVLALLCGLGGGNFASSMANISFFFPNGQKGFALGLNAGLGNLGVSLAQFVVPLAVAAGLFGALGGEPQTWGRAGEAGGEARLLWLQNAGFVWLPFIVLATLAAALGMDDLAAAKASFAEQATILRRADTWRLSWLYLGSFGSFIGFAAGFPLLAETQFPHANVLHYAWLGPLIAALARPVGGWLADQLGAARVTLWNFAALALAVCGALLVLPSADGPGSFHGFLAAFLALFVVSGLGNGSTFRMIPAAFQASGAQAAAALGVASAFGAFGGFFIPKSYGTALALTGAAQPALYAFIVFYLSCIALTWRYYLRRHGASPDVRSMA